MTRDQRDYFEYGRFYHIYNRTVDGRKLFESEDDFHYFLERYNKYFGNYFDTYAYCLIPNHFHLLVKLREESEIDVTKEKTKAARKFLSGEESINFFIENQLSRMFSGIAIKYNNRLKGDGGPLFEKATKRVLLETESRIVYQLCYIHHNVIHHHLGKAYNDWKYSSYLAYLSDKPSRIDRDFMIDLVGGIDTFLELHQAFKLERKEDLNDEFCSLI